MKTMKIAHVTFVLMLLELFFGSNSFKASHSRDAADETPLPQVFAFAENRDRGGKVCVGVHAIVSNASSASLLESKSAIPRVIHVTFRSIAELPQCVPDTLQKINPGFKVWMWGDKEIISFLKKNFSQNHAGFFMSIPDGEIKSDFFRLAVISKIGGWYTDMDMGLLQPFDKFADTNADIILSGSVAPRKVNPIIFAARPGNAVIKHALDKIMNLQGTPYEYWRWSVTTNLWLALNDEFGGQFEPSNIMGTKISPHGLNVQMLKEQLCEGKAGTYDLDQVAVNQFGCQPGLTEMAPHR